MLLGIVVIVAIIGVVVGFIGSPWMMRFHSDDYVIGQSEWDDLGRPMNAAAREWAKRGLWRRGRP